MEILRMSVTMRVRVVKIMPAHMVINFREMELRMPHHISWTIRWTDYDAAYIRHFYFAMIEGGRGFGGGGRGQIGGVAAPHGFDTLKRHARSLHDADIRHARTLAALPRRMPNAAINTEVIRTGDADFCAPRFCAGAWLKSWISPIFSA